MTVYVYGKNLVIGRTKNNWLLPRRFILYVMAIGRKEIQI